MPLDAGLQWSHVPIVLLMDIRDQLGEINSRLACYRIPKALDAVIELGRKKRRRRLNERQRHRPKRRSHSQRQ